MPSQNGRPQVATIDGHAVAGDGHEAGLAEVEQAGVAEVDVEADGGEAVGDGRSGRAPCWRAEAEDLAASPWLSFLLADPLALGRGGPGVGKQDDDEHASAPTYFSSAGMNRVDSSMKRPMMSAADDGAPDRAEAAEGDGGEDQQQDLEADLVVEALGHARGGRRPGRPGRRRRSRPPDHAVDVDAGRGGERRVVGDGAGGLAEAGLLQRRGTTTTRTTRAEDR